MGKKIEIVELPISELKKEFGNPRIIKRKKKDELQESIEKLGYFGIFVIDENNNILSGNQSMDAMMNIDPTQKVLCKRLIGYSDAEKRAVNIKANTHAGEWDMDALAEWTADLHMDLDFNIPDVNVEERKIKDMELIRYEKYDYVMIVCRNEVDYLNLIRALGIEGKKVVVGKTKTGDRKIKARAIWYDDMKAQIQPKEK